MKLKSVVYSLSVAGAAGMLFGATALPAYAASHRQSTRPLESSRSNQPFKHVYVIMMENQGTPNIIGNSQLPYINKLAKQYGYENNYFGVTHESLANYVAFFSGNNWGTHSDNPTQTFNHTNLVDQLASHHITWKGYMQSMPYPGFKGYWYPDNEPKGTAPSKTPPNALYALKHNPFTLMTDIANHPSREKNVVPFTQLQTDLNHNRVPNFSFITPNVINDMHGQPPGPGSTVTYNDPAKLYQAGDNFVKRTVKEIMSSRSWKTSKSIIFVTWDEANYPYPPSSTTSKQLKQFTAPGPDAPIVPAGTVDGYKWPGGAYGGGKVPMIMIDNAFPHHFTLNTWANHYSLLRTIEQNWHLGFIGYASDSRQVKTLPVPGEPQLRHRRSDN
ncbi:alkaline phosphatase family protein [Alicyclobacillus sp. SO9]|uniref:alkaline phosphatase family protein n=1 Tax=Alicyclobacillus sp. SO9 TaxID=2665646 RepID=UPI0018E70C9C|nr:alkaline phosphatase family protein [Alicyclobacillus sp. SO9]QQE80645.1 hypothetical protein GI364_09740 [Alicyclobacillus sp. SO9]